MKKLVFVTVVLLGLSIMKADAQYVRVKPGFSVNISFNAPGPPPSRGMIWVAPEWVWRHGHYVEIPGHWVRRSHGVWISGRWENSRRGYRWRPGHWR